MNKLLAKLNPFAAGILLSIVVYLAVQATTGDPAREETIIALILGIAAGVWAAFRIHKARQQP